MNKEQKIFQSLQNHYLQLKEHINEEQILGVFLYGSQNYGTDLPSSDVDTKAIYIPTLQDVLFEKKPLSKEFIWKNGEHCDIKDIREYIKCLKFQNLNYVETLFTDYFFVNPKYSKIWNDYFLKNREDIARYHPPRTILAMASIGQNFLKNNFYTGKDISNARRILYFLNQYIKKEPYKRCFYIKDERLREKLKDLKQYYPTPIEDEKILKKSFEHFYNLGIRNLNMVNPKTELELIFEESVLEAFHLLNN